jgi:hypothetical protein
MYSNDELVIQATMEDEANTNTYEDEHLKVISLFAFTSGAKFGSQMWRLKVREKEDHATTEGGGPLHALRRPFSKQRVVHKAGV